MYAVYFACVLVSDWATKAQEKAALRIYGCIAETCCDKPSIGFSLSFFPFYFPFLYILSKKVFFFTPRF